jgi:hypothetical protein
MKDVNELIEQNKKKKVFCVKCKHLEFNKFQPKCWGFSKDTWLEAGGEPENPKKKNKYNNCSAFEPK